MLSIDLQYLRMLPLQLFTQKDSRTWNFRCPVCGDSERKKSLKRGNAQIWDGNLFIKCFNCSYSSKFSYFIRTEFPELYKSYRLDVLRSRNICPSKSGTKTSTSITPVKRSYTNINLPTIVSLTDKLHPAYKEVIHRQIPTKFHDLLYYTDNYQKWVNSILPGTFQTIPKSDKRIVIPFFDKFHRLIGMQGRTLENRIPKYLTSKIDETDDLLYGLDRLNDTKKIYVTEGPIDSMFLDNAIATRTAIAQFDKLEKIAPIGQFVLVYDNEKRNTDTVRFMTKALELGFTIVIWPKDIEAKDLNEIILKKNLTKVELCAIIDSNSYKGKSGLIKLKFWKR